MVKSMKRAVRDNRRFHKYDRMLRHIRLRIFDYEDSGKLEKAQRVIERIKAICNPIWQTRAKRLENKTLDRLRWW